MGEYKNCSHIKRLTFFFGYIVFRLQRLHNNFAAEFRVSIIKAFFLPSPQPPRDELIIIIYFRIGLEMIRLRFRRRKTISISIHRRCNLSFLRASMIHIWIIRVALCNERRLHDHSFGTFRELCGFKRKLIFKLLSKS